MNIDSMRTVKGMRTLFLVLLLLGTVPSSLAAVRLKEVATIKGVRDNILIGYGIVVGLKGTGDSSTDVTSQSLTRLFGKLGLDVGQGAAVKSKNAAAVIATASLPPFARIGSKIDVSVSSIGDASSLEGGILLVTPLRAGDQSVYAVAQGSVSLGALADGGGKNFSTVARISNGATIEKDIDVNFAAKKNFRLALNSPDFTTAARVVNLINAELGGKFATARDSGTVDIVVPFHYEGNSVELLAKIENIQVHLDRKAKIIINERTGTIVMGGDVKISPIAISHGDLAIEVPKVAAAGAPPAAGGGNAPAKKESIFNIQDGAQVSDLVKVLNTLGVKPKDLTAIFQSLKEAGALQAELEIL